MQLIIPMSGIGNRFIQAGYKIPKPLLEVENKIIINHVCDMFKGIDKTIFICNKNHLDDKSLHMNEKIRNINIDSKIVSIDPHKNGPIYAVLKAIDHIDLDLPTIVNYCDFNCIWNYEMFRRYVVNSNCDGCVVTYKGFHPHMLGNTNYAYIKLDNSQIIDIQEKKSFTLEPMNENASSGTYYFKSALLMKKYFEKTIENDLNVKGEYYVSMSYKLMIKDNLKLNNFNIDYFMQWGTPADLEEFKWFSNLFKAIINEKISIETPIKGTLMIPCAGLGKRFADQGYLLPKPLVEVLGNHMFVKAIYDLPSMNNIKLIIRDNMDNRDILEKKAKENFSNIKIQSIKSETNGQASTCLLGLEDVELNEPLIISACDNGVIYNKEYFRKLTTDNTIDIIVWGCRNFPGAIKSPEMYGWIEEEDSIVKKIHVKKKYKDPHIDPIITGTFFFKNAKLFKKIGEDLISSDLKVNDEFYVDSSINNAIELGFKVVYFEVDFYLCWGTPDDLKTFKYWQNCFDSWKVHNYKKNLIED